MNKMTFGLVISVLLLALTGTVQAQGRSYGSGHVDGWRLGPEREHGGYAIFRRDGRGWYRMPGGAVRIGGSSRSPWVVNNRDQIFFWSDHGWARMPGTAIDVADGWAIGTKRESGGYAIYRWNGYDWDQAPGGAVEIGGSYERPWVVNNRGERFTWNGYDWDLAYYGYRGGGNQSYRGNRSHRGRSVTRNFDRNDAFRGYSDARNYRREQDSSRRSRRGDW